MKLHLLNRSSEVNRSLTISLNRYPNFLRIWHFHEEYELVLIVKSSGMRFVGDNIESFNKGDIVLIGKNLPHMWLNDDVYFEENSNLETEAISVHFKDIFLGQAFLALPEMQSISSFLKRAHRGIKFLNIDDDLITEIATLVELNPVNKITSIIEILDKLSKHQDIQILASSGFVNSFRKTENKRLDKIYEYVFENFNTPISSREVAEIAGMNASAFSRFFKKTHRKSFTRYLNELRIGYACKLLLENQESITSIAFLSGFNNISNFNRQFKLIKGKAPSAYLKDYNYE